MLMQSSDGAVHLLPALPDDWKTGSISGLRALGGFEVTELQWKDGILVKVSVRSNLGGNLRLRSETPLKITKGTMKEATGINPNPFYQVSDIAPPLVSPVADIALPTIAQTFLYDISTKAGRTFTFLAE